MAQYRGKRVYLQALTRARTDNGKGPCTMIIETDTNITKIGTKSRDSAKHLTGDFFLKNCDFNDLPANNWV
jgi:hypothetical protein